MKKTIFTLSASLLMAGAANAAAITTYTLRGNTNVTNEDAELDSSLILGTGGTQQAQYYLWDSELTSNDNPPLVADIFATVSLTADAGKTLSFDSGTSVSWKALALKPSGFASDITTRSNVIISDQSDFSSILLTSSTFTAVTDGVGDTFTTVVGTYDASSLTGYSTLYFGFTLTDDKNSASNYQSALNDLQIDGAVVPEPSSYALLAGLLGLSYVMVRRREA